MILGVFVLQVTGESNKVLALVPQPDDGGRNRQVLQNRTRAAIQAALSKDYERGLRMGGMAMDNPTLRGPAVNPFFGSELKRKSLNSLNLPIDMGEYSIIDAFVCMGSRFGMERLEVFVALCQSAGLAYWADIYYLAQPSRPAGRVNIELHLVDFNADYLLNGLNSFVERATGKPLVSSVV